MSSRIPLNTESKMISPQNKPPIKLVLNNFFGYACYYFALQISLEMCPSHSALEKAMANLNRTGTPSELTLMLPFFRSKSERYALRIGLQLS